jgi:hypothetical protein
LARRILSDRYREALRPGSLPGVAKVFDFVSPDHRVVGDAKYFSLAGGVGLPAAKFSIVAEHIWLLEKSGASAKFLVSAISARCRSGGWRAMVSWPQASRSSF